MPSDICAAIPDGVELSARAVRDLKGLVKANRAETLRIVADIARLGRREAPSTQIKKLSGLGALWQMDSGRYRIVFLWSGQKTLIVTVFPKHRQSTVFRGLH